MTRFANIVTSLAVLGCISPVEGLSRYKQGRNGVYTPQQAEAIAAIDRELHEDMMARWTADDAQIVGQAWARHFAENENNWMELESAFSKALQTTGYTDVYNIFINRGLFKVECEKFLPKSSSTTTAESESESESV